MNWDEIYQPLVEEIEKYSHTNWSIRERVKVPLLKDIVNNSYKYGISNKLLNQCNHLLKLIDDYNRINTIRIAHSIITNIFEKGYAEIYGSIIAGVVHQSDKYGNEWKDGVVVEPIQIIRQNNYEEEIETLLLNEGVHSDKDCINRENGLYEPIYFQLKQIYN